MTNVLITGIGAEHDDEVAQSFIIGYQLTGARFGGNLLVQNFGDIENAMSYALTSNIDFVIQSTVGASFYKTLSNTYYPDVALFMPSGSNSYVQVYNNSTSANEYSIVLCGTFTGNNEVNVTGYNIEFLDKDPIYGQKISSYANGYVAGKIAYIKDYFNCSFFDARMIARLTANSSNNFTDNNGYGVINLQRATTTQVNIPIDDFVEMTIGSITTDRINNKVTINIDSVLNANYYNIYRNEQLVYSGTSLSFTDIIIPASTFYYKYQAVNNKYQTSFSDESEIVYRAYPSIIIK